MMKSLIMVRHAKSSWSDFTLSDFDRPLNERGKHDAPMMARRLLKRHVPVELFISSPAVRARTTAEYFIVEYGLDPKEIRLVRELYHAPLEVIYDVIAQVEDRYDHIAVFCHNPGITHFVNDLTQQVSLDNMPTCATFAVQAEIRSWKEFRASKKQFWFFDYPKNQAEK